MYIYTNRAKRSDYLPMGGWVGVWVQTVYFISFINILLMQLMLYKYSNIGLCVSLCHVCLLTN